MNGTRRAKIILPLLCLGFLPSRVHALSWGDLVLGALHASVQKLDADAQASAPRIARAEYRSEAFLDELDRHAASSEKVVTQIILALQKPNDVRAVATTKKESGVLPKAAVGSSDQIEVASSARDTSGASREGETTVVQRSCEFWVKPRALDLESSMEINLTEPVCVRRLTKARGDGNAWWEFERSAYSLDTLFFGDKKAAVSRSLILHKEDPNPEMILTAGTIMVEHPAGLSLKILTDGTEVAAGETRTVFYNVPSGLHTIRVTRTGDKLMGTLTVMAKTQSATILKLPEAQAFRFSGRVVYTDPLVAAGALKQSQIEWIGNPRVKFNVSDTGEMQSTLALRFEGFPITLDLLTEKTGYRYRQEVRSPDVSLFAFNDARVDYWVSQLDGEIDSTSGIILSSVDAEKNPAARSPFVAELMGVSIRRGDESVPEIYSLGQKDRLEDAELWQKNKNLWVGIQVPEGPRLVGQLDKNKGLDSAQIRYIQPGVVNILLF